jgi:hypothetical protein
MIAIESSKYLELKINDSNELILDFERSLRF